MPQYQNFVAAVSQQGAGLVPITVAGNLNRVVLSMNHACINTHHRSQTALFMADDAVAPVGLGLIERLVDKAGGSFQFHAGFCFTQTDTDG